MPYTTYSMAGYGGLWMVFHAAFWLLLVAALLGVFVIPPKRGSGERGRGPATALDLLDQRYAKGEIERDEYLQRKKDIQGNPPEPASPQA